MIMQFEVRKGCVALGQESELRDNQLETGRLMLRSKLTTIGSKGYCPDGIFPNRAMYVL